MMEFETDFGSNPKIVNVKNAFLKAFESEPQVVVQVPGRVNIIGEHIDYCGYGVHPMAIEQDILVAVAYSHGIDFKITF